MAKRVIYFSNEVDNDSMSELEIYQNAKGNLFVSLSPFESHSSDCFVELSPEDAKEIITSLAREFGMLDEESVEGYILFNPSPSES